MGKISITSKQAAYFEVKPYSQWSPDLEKYCLLLSANSSYEHASEDLKVLTGMSVSRGTQQRLVQRHDFELPTVSEAIEEIRHSQEKESGPEQEWPTVSEAIEEIKHSQEKESGPEQEWLTVSEVIEEISHPEEKGRRT
ncbi:MAG: hypothetical protein GDA48_11190 [Hormoscilla sp. GM102CHS1]|nr:hypothetical protein [Hormoscilla sp. GM102CHS1]